MLLSVWFERHVSAPSLPPLGSAELDRQRTFWRLTLEMGIAMERAYLAWLDQCEAVVREMDWSSEGR